MERARFVKLTGSLVEEKKWFFMVVWYVEGESKMKNIIIGIIVFFALWFILPFIGFTRDVLPNVIEWATKFILPWIILYWIIRLVKVLEKSK